MRKLLIILMVLISSTCLFACNDSKQELFSLEDEKKELYNKKINEILKKDHWNYDERNTIYEEGVVPDEYNEDFDDVKEASNIEGFNIDEFKGKNAILATVRLFHFNNDEAGKGYFYFVDDEVVCGYYIYADDIYSISQINVFVENSFNQKQENIEKKLDFKEIQTTKVFDGFEDVFAQNNKSIIGTISEDKAKFFTYKDYNFSLEKEFDFSKQGLFPMDLSFNDNGSFAILLGKKKKTEHQILYSEHEIQEMKENGLTDADINGEEILIADSIVFFNSKYENEFSPCKLEVSSYSSITYTNGQIFVSRGKGIDLFTNENGIFNKTKQYLIKHWVEKIKADDIDGDGVKEFIMVDDTNLFIYRLQDVPSLIWKTHLSLEAMNKRFYISDLNNDGIKEIYVSDYSLKTTTKYYLSDKCFKTTSMDYNTEHLVGDFDGNGKTDYIVIDNEDDSCKVCIAN